MKSGYRSRVTFMGALAGRRRVPADSRSSAAAPAAMAIEPPRSAIYTASDFKRLADGVDPGFSGEAVVSVWAPATTAWHLTTSRRRRSPLKLEAAPGDPTPRWQSLGKITLAKAAPLKAVVANDSLTEKREGQEPRRRPRTRRRCSRPRSRSALHLARRRFRRRRLRFDLVRGRVDSTEPSHDTRRSHSRTNNEGVDFQAPASRRRLARPRPASARTDAGHAGTLADVPQDRRSTPRSPASSTAAITRSRKSCSKPFPGLP